MTILTVYSSSKVLFHSVCNMPLKITDTTLGMTFPSPVLPVLIYSHHTEDLYRTGCCVRRTCDGMQPAFTSISTCKEGHTYASCSGLIYTRILHFNTMKQ